MLSNWTGVPPNGHTPHLTITQLAVNREEIHQRILAERNEFYGSYQKQDVDKELIELLTQKFKCAQKAA